MGCFILEGFWLQPNPHSFLFCLKLTWVLPPDLAENIWRPWRWRSSIDCKGIKHHWQYQRIICWMICIDLYDTPIEMESWNDSIELSKTTQDHALSTQNVRLDPSGGLGVDLSRTHGLFISPAVGGLPRVRSWQDLPQFEQRCVCAFVYSFIYIYLGKL